MHYCGYCGGLLPQGSYKFCGHCGKEISGETTLADPILPTAPASLLPSPLISSASQERDEAYRSLCHQYESESIFELHAVIVVRIGDDQIGKRIGIVSMFMWNRQLNLDTEMVELAECAKYSPVDWQSVGSRTIPVAIFKCDYGAHLIWIEGNPARHIIAVPGGKATLVDLR